MGLGHKKTTPGRPKKQGTQYFDIGKVGRKTGITLPDPGIRDEHGLEPVSHIFSSPGSPLRAALDSSDAQMHETSTMLTEPSPGSGPDLDLTLASRKTPRLPPARASTPKHTNIGSPKRPSTGRPVSHRFSAAEDESPARGRSQPRPNRALDFDESEVQKSIETNSPVKPRHVLRRSTGAGAQNPFVSPARAVAEARVTPVNRVDDVEDAAHGAEVGLENEMPQFEDDGPLLNGDDDYQPADHGQEDNVAEAGENDEAPADTTQFSRTRRYTGSANNSTLQQTPRTTSSRKRNRTTLDATHPDEANESHASINGAGPASKKQRGSRTSDSRVFVHQDEADANIDPALLDDGDDSADVEMEVRAASQEPAPARGRAKTKGKGKKAKAPKERDPNRAMRAESSKVQLNDSPSKIRDRRESSRSLSVGPISNVHLRASTPYEDAGRTSRYGRNLLAPLKYWANEMRIYKHGETAGIVRADPVSPKKRNVPKKKKSKKKNVLGDIDEESDTESILPDEWEEDIGVVAGDIANWDPEKQQGDPEDLVREDLAFASTSIVAKDVHNTTFKYAKIMTLPFFGSGLVELPPGGEKRAKNCRKMQMCFFVHEGKVMVEVFAAGEGVEIHQFAISKGGVWVVPRGNNYSITNESRTKTAKIFFAQGCEVVEMGK